MCQDLSRISEFGNFSNTLNLKDFSLSNKFLNSILVNENKEHFPQTEFVKVTLDEDSMMIIKKSSLCWLFDNNNKKVSNDRLRRFVNKKTNKRSPQQEIKSKDLEKKAENTGL